jgi:hypothetical protein
MELMMQMGFLISQTVNGFGFDDGIVDNEYRGLRIFVFFLKWFISNSDPNSL